MVEELNIGKDEDGDGILHPESAEEPDHPRHGRTKGRRPVNVNRRGGIPERSSSGKGGSKAAGGSSSGSGKRKKKLWYKKNSSKK